jgi:Uma2 family endonuclease
MHSLAEQAVIDQYTREDHQRWEGDWELIQGIPLAMAPPPGIAHQRVSGRLYSHLAAALDGCPDCEVLFEIDAEFSQSGPSLVRAPQATGSSCMTSTQCIIMHAS